MKQRTLLFSVAAVALMALVIANPALAQGTGDVGDAGSAASQTLVSVITGNIGLLIGLGITVMGLWTWIIGQKTAAGLTMVVGGVLLTMAPGIFKGARDMAVGVVEGFGGDAYEVTDAQSSGAN